MAEKQVKNFLSKNRDILIISLIYFLFRLTNLTLLPIFNDEAIYLDWGWKELHLPDNLFYSLLFGNQPFLMWIFGGFESIFLDPLFAGRFVSVLIGFLSMLGIYKIGRDFFTKNHAFTASLVYIITPAFSFFDRQALMESAIAAVGIWSCYYFVKLQLLDKRKYVLLLGLILGVGFFIKSNALIFITTFLLLQFFLFIAKPSERKRILSNTLLTFLVILIVDFVLITHPLFTQGFLRVSNLRSLTIPELLQFPLSIWLHTARDAFEIAFWYMTPILLLLSIIGIFLIAKTQDKKKKFVLFWFLISFFMLFSISRALQPRYIVSFLPLLPVFCSYCLFFVWERHRAAASFLAFIGCIIPLWFIALQLFSPIDYFSTLAKVTRFPQKSEYVTDWPAGYGVIETVAALEKISQSGTYVGVRPDAGNPESAMFTYFNKSKRVLPVYINAQMIKPWSKNNCIQSNGSFYFVARDTQLAGLERYTVEEVKRVYKPEGKSFISIYRLNTDCGEKKI